MEQITIKNLTFAYDTNSDFSLNRVSLEIEQGEILLLTGLSGCGKTTLLKHLKIEYMPQGVRSNESEIWIAGRRIQELDEREQARLVGFVGQNVDASQVTDKVWHEMAFGLENLGCSQDVMKRKIAEMTAFFGLEGIYHEKLCNLSGGQKQLVNLASVMAMEPEVLVLDEPTSQLDPIAATEFFQMIEKINRELGTTILMTEHRLEEVFSMCHRVCVMEQGKIVAIDTPQNIAGQLYAQQHTLSKALPTVTKLYLRLQGERNQIPLTVNEGRSWLKRYVVERGKKVARIEESLISERKRENLLKDASFALNADELWFRYEKDSKDILKACSLKLAQGKITAVLGGNGAGKSTLLNVIAGYLTAYLGKVKGVSGSIGMLPQNPQAMFSKKTVEEELQDSVEKGTENKLEYKGQYEEEVQSVQDERLERIIEFCDLQQVLTQHPFDLSGGQMQKLALAKLLLEDKEILLLDEPGKGMDYAFKEEMGKLLQSLVSRGKTVLMVSHDVEFCAKFADVCGLFFDGAIVSLVDSRKFFLQNTFYTTSVVRMCRGVLPQAVVMEDVLKQFDESVVVDIQEKNQVTGNYQEQAVLIEKTEVPRKKTEHKLSRIITLCMIFFVMPLTIYVGNTVLFQRKYYFISLLLVIEAVVCFWLRFEKRKPKVREIMIIAMMTAIVVAGRAVFYMIPNLKPMVALVILTGIGLGAEVGFLVGSMSMLVSNIFFGQGPWTPWQMFAMGMLGFLAGAIFKRDVAFSKKRKYGICLFGFWSVVFIYGGILNPASVLMYQENVNLKMILAACMAGFPFDVMHGIATVAFLWIGTGPMLEKMERVRKKYGFED